MTGASPKSVVVILIRLFTLPGAQIIYDLLAILQFQYFYGS
jgi:hypothetical protein